jgi:FKBP-type peptidyl-prolyl cis-trans isomerase
MRNLLFIAFLLSIAHASLAQAPTTQPPKAKAPVPAPAKPAAPALKTTLDSVSYAIGLMDGKFFKQQGFNQINGTLLGKGFSDALSGKTILTPEQADGVIRRQLQAMARKNIDKNIQDGKTFLANNAKRPGVKQTSSGLQYEVLKEGDGMRPTDSSTVKVHYEGTLLNGKKFDSSRDRGEPTSFPLNRVIAGWTEGLQLMKAGSRYKFYIPHTIGYGETGAGENIPGGAVLVFDVELLEVVDNPQKQ